MFESYQPDDQFWFLVFWCPTLVLKEVCPACYLTTLKAEIIEWIIESNQQIIQ